MATYLITGATGQQGSATIKYLLKAGAKAHAMVRNPQSEAAQALQAQGVKLFQFRDYLDFDAFREAAKGCQGLFLNLMPSGEGEKQAIGIIEACKAAGVKSIVASTAFWCGSKEKWTEGGKGEDRFILVYFTEKAKVEA
jgi:uncharacterized protein YbjT (DUF2867 family)